MKASYRRPSYFVVCCTTTIPPSLSFTLVTSSSTGYGANSFRVLFFSRFSIQRCQDGRVQALAAQAASERAEDEHAQRGCANGDHADDKDGIRELAVALRIDIAQGRAEDVVWGDDVGQVYR